MKISRKLQTWTYLGLIAISVMVSAVPGEAAEGHHGSGAPITVIIDAFQFQPDTIRIKRGQKVIFINKDEVPHTVTSGKNADFVSSGIIKGGEQHVILFESVGKQDYSCDFHPSMQGQVLVQ